jgi:hypothetical protein
LLGSDTRNTVVGCGGVAGIVGASVGKNKTSAPSSNASASNRFSRFLSTHPVIASTLCFATPVTDSTDEPESVDYDVHDGFNNPNVDEATSVVSGDNTLNTAEDTVTSTLYYETTKLAGLSQTSPPMPLFKSFCVDECDDINRIISTHSHLTSKPKQPENHLDLHQRRPKFGAGAFNAQPDSKRAPSPRIQRSGPDRSPRPTPNFRPASAIPVADSPQSAVLSSRRATDQEQPPLRQRPPEPLAAPAQARANRRPRLDEGVPAAVSSSDSSRSQP